jgi:phosphatidate cytidylyltransferase
MKKLSEYGSLTQRIVSAVILAPIVLYILWIGGLAWQILAAIICIICLWEWYRMTKSQSKKFLWLTGGAFYIIPPCIMLAQLNQKSQWISNQDILFTIIIAVWAVDIFAYAFGRVIGGPKIAPKISPNKTWAGLLGGSVGASAIFIYNGSSNVNDIQMAIIIGSIFAIVAQAGDFFESWVKRTCGVKDSSNIIPGHGGLLDRIDGLLAVSWLIVISSTIASIS